MKVLHVYKSYLPETYGGLEQAIFQLCTTTTNMGVENRVLTLSQDGSNQALNRPEAIVFPLKRNFEIASCGFSFSALTAFSQFHKWADLIHYHFPWPFADLLHCLYRIRTPSLTTYHSDIVRQKALAGLYTPLMHRFLGSLHRIIATSPNYANTSPILQSYQDKVRIIPLGIDPKTYPAADPARVEDWRHRIGQDFFLFVGVLRYYKGLHILLEALHEAPFKAVIVGAGPIEQELKRKAMEKRLDNVFFLGFQSDQDKMALYELCRAVVFPSHMRSEAFGITILEALMAGRPIISSEIGTGTSFANADGESGFVIEPSNPKALRRAMEQLFEDPELASKLGRQANQRFKQHFTTDKMGQKYLEQYQALLKPGLHETRPSTSSA